MDDDDELEAAISAAHHLGVVVDSVVRLTSVVNTVAAAGELLSLIELCARAVAMNAPAAVTEACGGCLEALLRAWIGVERACRTSTAAKKGECDWCVYKDQSTVMMLSLIHI